MSEKTVSVPKDVLERICGMVYATRGEQIDRGYINGHEYAQLVSLRHGGYDAIETVLTALQSRVDAEKDGTKSLLRKPSEPLPEGCYCEPGKCMAPKIMGVQMPCRDPKKAAAGTEEGGR